MPAASLAGVRSLLPAALTLGQGTLISDFMVKVTNIICIIEAGSRHVDQFILVGSSLSFLPLLHIYFSFSTACAANFSPGIR